MKKTLLILPVLLFLAVGCNSQDTAEIKSSAAVAKQQTPVKPATGVDGIVNDLSQSVKSEQTVQTQSDTDIVTSDRGVVTNTSQGVPNAY